MTKTSDRMTVPRFRRFKATGDKITMLTAYDYPSARLADEAGVEAVLVGDSLGMVVQGQETTLPVTLDEMIYHATMVGRGVRRAMLVIDMPFPTYHVSTAETIVAAAKVFQLTRCQAVKIEGGAHRADRIEALVGAGIPVMAHIGLTPQNVHQMGGYRVPRERDTLLDDARAVERAGAFAVVLECIPAEIAVEITDLLSIPSIGIGAGPACDGQILVFHDLLGLGDGPPPRHVRPYADLGRQAVEAIQRYRDDVRNARFPGDKETIH